MQFYLGQLYGGQVMDETKPGFWERYERVRKEITNSPRYRERQRQGLIEAAVYGLVGVPLVVVLMLCGVWMGWSVTQISGIAMLITMATCLFISKYLIFRKKPS